MHWRPLGACLCLKPRAGLGAYFVFLDQCFVCLNGANTKQLENFTKNLDLIFISVEKVEDFNKLDPFCCMARLLALRVPVPIPTWVMCFAKVPTTPCCLKHNTIHSHSLLVFVLLVHEL